MQGAWFKFYPEIIDDPKISMMSDTDQLLWVKLLCLVSLEANRKGFIDLSNEEASWRLRVPLETWLQAVNKFVARGLVKLDNDSSIVIIDWHKRYKGAQQYGQDGRPPISLWLKLREIVFERDGYTCQYCGYQGDDLHCDHIIPVSRGGSSDLDNLTTACASCNLSKHNKTPDEWLGGSL